MKVFVTGGTGFIGSHFIELALNEGLEVLALRRKPTSKCKIDLSKQPEWLDKQLTEVSDGDLEGCDAIVHLAAHSANVPYDTLENCIVHNVLEPLGLFRTAVKAGIKQFIIAGSCFEYGRSGGRYKNIPVDAPLEPTSSYSASKAASSNAFYAFACENGIQMQYLRIFQTYGEGELETRFWPSLVRCARSGEDFAMSSGEQIRDFINVRDVAAQFIQALCDEEVQASLPVIRNIGTGIEMTLAEFARREWAKYATGGKLRIGSIEQRKNEVMRFVPEL